MACHGDEDVSRNRFQRCSNQLKPPINLPLGSQGYFLLILLAITSIFSSHVSNVDADQSRNPSAIQGSLNQLINPPYPPSYHNYYKNSSQNGPTCDFIKFSTPTSKNGTFPSPEFENPLNHSRQCLYTFVASENERVSIEFTNFNLRGKHFERKSVSTTTVCNYEYLDIYMEVKHETMKLIDTPFGGRYCGIIAPRYRISLYRVMTLGFHTEFPEVMDSFSGKFEFISADKYVVGTPVPNTKCSFTVTMASEDDRNGQVISPTYPGVYPKGLNCEYTFRGKKNQRILIELMDFDLFYGGSHCPFDYVKFYDGSTESYPEIGTYCGQHRNLKIYSSTENLLMKFITLERTTDSQNRGFYGKYQFSESFVNLEFITAGNGTHIRGTECDQKRLSQEDMKNGTFFSPNYPFPYQNNVVCRYYIYGLEDSQNLERVHVKFDELEISTDADKSCTNGFLRVYLQGQEERHAFEEYDNIFCGHIANPPKLISSGPRLVIVFSSGTSKGRSFKGQFWFETYYQIPGTAAPGGACDFTYRSTTSKRGIFNSPRHPRNYPMNLECFYHLIGKPDDQIELSFTAFETAINTTDPIFGYMDNCKEDYVEVYEVRVNGNNTFENLLGRYCGATTPGPIVTDKGVHRLLVKLRSDGSKVAGGFRTTYRFLSPKDIAKRKECGHRFINDEEYGVISSPNYPGRYDSAPIICEWIIEVDPKYKIMLIFPFVAIEGEPISRGCSPAAVRVWTNMSTQPLEFCGTQSAINNGTMISTSNTMRIKFTTSEKAVGGDGFKAVWTKILQGNECSALQCSSNGYCIDVSLRCNSERNCGWHDNTDEAGCVTTAAIDMYALIGIVFGSIFICVVCLCIWCQRKAKRKREEEKKREHRQKSFCDATGLRISNDSV